MERRSALTQLFPGDVVVEEEDPLTTPADLSLLYPEEVAAVAKAIDKRRREFIAGRRCARRALEALGQRPGPLPPNPDRSPPWPEGFVGSITHTQGDRDGQRWGWCGAVVAEKASLVAVGIDAEPMAPVSAEIFDKILTVSEHRWLDRLSASERGIGARMVFSAKEAFYKAQYLESATYLGFHDVELCLDGLRPDEGGAFEAKLLTSAGARFAPGDRIEGRVAILEGLIVSVSWLKP